MKKQKDAIEDPLLLGDIEERKVKRIRFCKVNLFLAQMGLLLIMEAS